MGKWKWLATPMVAGVLLYASAVMLQHGTSPTQPSYTLQVASEQATATAIALNTEHDIAAMPMRYASDALPVAAGYAVVIIGVAYGSVLVARGLRRNRLLLLELQINGAIAYERARQSAEAPRIVHYHGSADATTRRLDAPEIARVATATNPQRATLEDVISGLPRNQLIIPLGIDDDGSVVTKPLPDAVHILLAGSSGAGKSYLAQAMIAALLARNDSSVFQLACFDIERQTSRPMRRYSSFYGTSPQEIVAGLETLWKEVERRQKLYPDDDEVGDFRPLDYGLPYILIFVEEATSLKSELKMAGNGLYERYTVLTDMFAARSRKWGLPLLHCRQTDYADNDFKIARGQFATKLAGYMLPSAGRSAGFNATPLLNQMWREKKPGHFLLEAPDGDRMIWSPTVNREELPALLRRHSRPIDTTARVVSAIADNPISAMDSEMARNGSAMAATDERTRVLKAVRGANNMNEAVANWLGRNGEKISGDAYARGSRELWAALQKEGL